jgi:hypothetical protein
MFDQHDRVRINGQRPAIAFLFALGVAMRAAVPMVHADPPTYTAQLLTPGISALGAAAMNEAGDAVGTSTTGSGGWVSHAGAPAVFLPLPPGAQYSFPTDINDAGMIVGAAGP